MSNLSLPKMTHVTLTNMLLNAEAKGKRGPLKIAYETTIERTPGTNHNILVRHHGNPIADIGPDFFTLDNAGWHSVTTANRLNHILRDNQTTLPIRTPDSPSLTDRLWYFVHVKNGEMLLSGRDENGKVQALRSFYSHSPHFSRTDSTAHFVLHG